MRKLFKNFNILGLVAFVAAGIMAISWTEMKKNTAFQWYQIEENGSTPSEKVILGLYPNGEPTTPCTSEDLTRPLCAAELDLPATISFPITMQDVIDNNYAQGETRHEKE